MKNVRSFLLPLVLCILWPTVCKAAGYTYEGTNDADLKTWASGAKAFKFCVNCHAIEATTSSMRFGPNLFAIVGRPVASQADYEYSPALRAAGGIWIKDRLNRFITRPSHTIDNTHMPYAGMLSPHARADLIEFLEAYGHFPANFESPDTLQAALTAGNATKGEALFAPCLACHTVTPDEGHKIGPNLYGVLGRRVASAAAFDYSSRLLSREGNWTPEALNAFFFEKKEFNQGSHIAFLRLNRLEDRANLIAWLQTLTPPNTE